MDEKKLISNIYLDMAQINRFVSIIDYIFNKDFVDRKSIRELNLVILMKNFIFRVREILYMVGMNFKDESTLNGRGFNNLNGALMLLRGLIETETIINILVTNNEEVSIAFFDQMRLDEQILHKRFNGSCKYYSVDKSQDISYRTYEWTKSFMDKAANSIHNLIDETNVVGKEHIALKKYLINYCNENSHPNIVSDYYYLEWARDGHLIQLQDLLSDMKQLCDMLYYSFYFMNKYIYDWKFLAHYKWLGDVLPKLLIEKNKKSDINNEQLEKFYVDIRVPDHQVEKSQADNIMFWIFTYTFWIGTRTDEPFRKNRVVSKLLETLQMNLKEFIIAYEEKRVFLFYSKLRFLLETFAYIDIALHFDEKRAEIYQIHTDVKRYVQAIKIPEHMQVDELGNKIDIEKIVIKVEGEDVFNQTLYMENLQILKEYFYDSYNIKTKTKTLKHPNGWAIKIDDDWTKPPRNLDIINHFITQYISDTNTSITTDYIKGLYTLSSFYCHTTLYSIWYSKWNKTKGLEESIFKETMRMLGYLAERMYETYPYITEFEEHLLNTKEKEVKTFKFSLDKLLNKKENDDKI